MPKRTAHIFEDKWRSDDVKLQEGADFSSLLLSERVLKGLKKAGFKNPSPIQLEAIPVGRFGNDLVVQAKSGTGKTLVFAIIALELLLDIQHPQVLILAPTREIAFQICDVIKSVGSAFDYFKCGAFIGGISIENDLQNIQGCQIVVGTPGRIRQLIAIKILKTSSIRLLVLDEADQLLDQSFKPDIDTIFVSLPKEKQIITTSATYPKKLKNLVNSYFRDNPFVARLNVNDLALLGIMHYTHIVEVSQMPVLAYKMKLQALEEVLTSVNFSQCLVFCNMISKVETICTDIKSWGFSTTYISSLKEQAARLKAIECLKRFKCKVLVSSDITSRGIDAENVDLIINIDVPYATEVYLHRVGRAGRFGSKGVAITFVARSEMESFTKIQKDGNFKSYILPDPVPANLINQRPEPKVKPIKENEERASESSDEEPILAEDISTNSCNIMQFDDQVLIGAGDSAIPIKSKVVHMNAVNSLDNSNQNEAFKNDAGQQYRLKELDNDLQHLEQSPVITKDELVNNIIDYNSSSSESQNMSEDKDSSEHPQNDYCSNKLFESNSIMITNMNVVPLTKSLGCEEADQMSLAKTSVEFSNKITIKSDSDVENPVLNSEDMPIYQNDIEMDPLRKDRSEEMKKIFEEFKVKKAKYKLKIEQLKQSITSTKENGELKILDKNVIDNSGSQDNSEIQKHSVSPLGGCDSKKVVAENGAMIKNTNVVPLTMSCLSEEIDQKSNNVCVNENSSKLTIENDSDVELHVVLNSRDMPVNQNVLEMDILREDNLKDVMKSECEQLDIIGRVYEKSEDTLEINAWKIEPSASREKEVVLTTLYNDTIDFNSVSQDKSGIQDSSENLQDVYNIKNATAAVIIKNIKPVPSTKPYESEEVSQKSTNVQVNEDSIKNNNVMQVPLLNSKDVPTHPNDLEINVFNSSASGNGSEKYELTVKKELKGNCDKVLRQNCIGEKKGRTVDDASCSSVTFCRIESSICDEVTTCVANFIEDYEKKNTVVLNGDGIAEKPIRLPLGKMKSPISLAWDRKCLSEYYYEVFRAFKKDTIFEDSFKQFVSQKSETEIPLAKEGDEECLIAVPKNDVMPTANKMDLIQWAMKIGNMKLNEMKSDSTDESTDDLSDYILESTPVKASTAKNTLLDVSSDTPSFTNPVDDLETDDSTSSKYSNKCFQLENTLKSKIETVKENLDSSEDIESTKTVGSRAVLRQKLVKQCKDITDQIELLIELRKGTKKMEYETANYFNESHEESSSDTLVAAKAHSFIKLQEILSNDKCKQQSEDTDSSTGSDVSSTNTLLERAFRAMSKNASDTKHSLPEQAAELKGVLEQLKSETPHSLQELYDESLSNIQITTAGNRFKKLNAADSALNNKSKRRFLSESLLCSKGSDSECSSSIESSSQKYFKAQPSSFKLCNGEKSSNTFHDKYKQSSVLSETSSSDCGSSVFPSNQPNRYTKKRSKATRNKVPSKADKASIHNSRESFEGADQSNYCPNYPQSSRLVDGSHYIHQGNLESAADSIHEHSDSCSWPSQHQCHYLNGHSSCQSQLCASWYDMFYKQWDYIQNASYFQ